MATEVIAQPGSPAAEDTGGRGQGERGKCVLKVEWGDGEGCQHEACCAGDGGWPSGIADSGGDPKPPHAASVKSWGRERCGKGPPRVGQVCDGKTNMCEPLLTHRNPQTSASKPGALLSPGIKARLRVCPEPGGDLCAVLVVPGV